MICSIELRHTLPCINIHICMYIYAVAWEGGSKSGLWFPLFQSRDILPCIYIHTCTYIYPVASRAKSKKEAKESRFFWVTQGKHSPVLFHFFLPARYIAIINNMIMITSTIIMIDHTVIVMWWFWVLFSTCLSTSCPSGKAQKETILLMATSNAELRTLKPTGSKLNIHHFCVFV